MCDKNAHGAGSTIARAFEAVPGVSLVGVHGHGLLPAEFAATVFEGNKDFAYTGRGFADAPVSWGGAEHGRATGDGGGGENDYSVVLLPGGQYALFVASGAADGFTKL